MKDIEIEIQVRVGNTAKLETFLKTHAKFLDENHQKDEYFTPAHRDFVAKKPVAEWLRLRTSKTNSITYKNWHYDGNGKSQYCDEYETDIADTKQLRKILTALNMASIITVDKTRRTWTYQKYEIALDRVVGLGDFIEIEYKSDDEEKGVNPKTITDGMITFLKERGCGQIERNFVGYPFMLLNPNEFTPQIL